MNPTQVKVLTVAGPAAIQVARAYMSQRQEEQRQKRLLEKEMELLEKRREIQEQKTRQAAQAAQGQVPQGSPQEQTQEPREGAHNGSDEREQLRRELDGIKERTTCRDCHRVADALKDAELETAKEGLEELKEFMDLKDELVEQDASQEEAEQAVKEKMEQFDVFPKMLMRA
jgi:hypothetical protein